MCTTDIDFFIKEAHTGPPHITVNTPNIINMYSGDVLDIKATGTINTCSGSSSSSATNGIGNSNDIYYKWNIIDLQNGQILRTIKSISNNPLYYHLPPHTLTTNTSYILRLEATTNILTLLPKSFLEIKIYVNVLTKI